MPSLFTLSFKAFSISEATPSSADLHMIETSSSVNVLVDIDDDDDDDSGGGGGGDDDDDDDITSSLIIICTISDIVKQQINHPILSLNH